MEKELEELKKVLRSLVVSRSTQVNCQTLMKDYYEMMGKPMPLAKFGYKEPVPFLKERCNDSFVLDGHPQNPVLTLIVPKELKHIDKFVQKQKLSSTVKHKIKRRSIPVVELSPPKNLICQSFIQNQKQKSRNIDEKVPEVNEDINEKSNEINNAHNIQLLKDEICSKVDVSPLKLNEEKTCNGNETYDVQTSDNGVCSKTAVEKFLKKRMPLYNSYQYLESETNGEKEHSKEDTDSGRQTLSSNGSGKWTQLEELKVEIKTLIEEHPGGVWCTDLIPLYRKRYRRELNFSRFGYTSVLSLACILEDGLVICRPEGSSDWKLLTRSPDVACTPLSLPPYPHAPQQTMPSLRKSRDTVDPDDALPGIDFEADVFPEDCMQFSESIPHSELPEESTIEVQVGELYSPSHLWLIRLGDDYNIAMEDVMDEMNEYYKRDEGKGRTLARGAVRLGHYCSSCYEGDWHRSLIVRILDSDTVKVRHVDYGTVDRCSVSDLRPLLRRWSYLPQQAIRARMAAVRPPAAGRRWPRSSAAHLLRTLTDKRLIAQIVARSTDEVLEVLLIDTSTDEDVCINTELVRSGHADSRPDSCLRTSECYLYPTFAALEGGDTPNYAELHSYLRDGIDLEYVEDFRRHVPSCLPSPPTSPDLPYLPHLPAHPSPKLLSPLEYPTTSNCPFSPLEYSTTSNRTLSLLEYPTTSIDPLSQLEHPESPLLLTNRVPLFPLGKEIVQSTPPARPHNRPTPLFTKPPVCTNPNLTNPVTADSDPPTQISTHKDQTDQVSTNPAPKVKISSSNDAAPTSCPKSTPTCTMETPTVTQPQPSVTLSASDCEVFRLLSRVDPNAAHRFMMEAIGRASKPPIPTSLNPEAKVFTMVPAQTQTEQPPRLPTNDPRNNYSSINSTHTQTRSVQNVMQHGPNNGYIPPSQTHTTHPVHIGPQVPFNRYTVPHTHPTKSKHIPRVYNGLQPNIPFNGFPPQPPMPGFNPVYNNTFTATHNGPVEHVMPAVQRFFENAHTMIPQQRHMAPPPGFEKY